MTLPAKLGFGALALGSAGGLGYVGTTYFNNSEEDKAVNKQKTKTIKELINEEYTHILLSTAASDNPDISHWTINWGQYKADNQKKPKGEDIFKLPKWTAEIGGGTNLISELKEKCASLKSSTSISDYGNVTKYCSREVTIKDQASKDSLKLISEEENDSNQAIWKAREDDKANLVKELKALELEGTNQIAEKIRQKCIDTKTKKKSDSTYEDTYGAYKKICAKKDTEK